MGRDVTTVVFDLGGVLIDWNPRYLYRKIFADESEMERFLTEITTNEWHVEQDRGRSLEDATTLLVSRHPEYEREIEAYYGRWNETLGGPIRGSVEVLRELREQEVPLYALTNWAAETFPPAGEQYYFLDWFHEIVVSGEEGLIKPNKEIYEVLVQRTGLEPASTVFIDDSPPNVVAAGELCFSAITFEAPDQLRADLVALGLLPETTERARND